VGVDEQGIKRRRDMHSQPIVLTSLKEHMVTWWRLAGGF
jgi:hypothetical protein